MMFETLLQGEIFLCFLFFGAICGIVFSSKKMIDKAFKKSKLIVLITDIVFMFLFSIMFIYAKNIYNFGEFRLFLLMAYIIGIVWEQISLDFLVVKFLKMSYNFFVRLFCKLKKTKFFCKIFK